MKTKIKFLDLKRQYLSIKNEIDEAIDKVIGDSTYSGGPYVEQFEENFAKYVGTKYAVGVSNGTDALHLAMIVLGVGKGDEIIVPANTFVATAWAASYVGAKPVFVDCDSNTWQIDPKKIEEKVTKKTKAIIGVHLYGQPFGIDEVIKITNKHKLFLVEDCAQAHGALYKGKKVGSFGQIATFSFYPSKNLGAYGEAGAILINNPSYAKRLQLLKNQGSIKKYEHAEIGFNRRMDGLQAAILGVKLKYLDNWNKRRRAIAAAFIKRIKNAAITLQKQPEWTSPVFHLFVVKTANRDKLKKFLRTKGIETGIHYPIPIHLQKACKSLGYREGDFPVAEDLAKHCLSIPIYPELTEREVETIINAINDYEI